jgi:hypothetical protein
LVAAYEPIIPPQPLLPLTFKELLQFKTLIKFVDELKPDVFLIFFPNSEPHIQPPSVKLFEPDKLDAFIY